MDVSFSAWRHAREESLELKGDSFSFLFDRRYTNRLNRMSRVFFEAYVKATKELAAQEDRFPSLSEIDAQMESGAVYAFKDRLMKNTEFFEEVKISGVSYLVPRALRFVDASGTYSDLILNFEEGAVVLPSRRKTPAPSLEESKEGIKEELSEEEPAIEEGEYQEPEAAEMVAEGPELPSEEAAAETTATQAEEAKPAEIKTDEQKANEYPAHAPEPFAPEPFAKAEEPSPASAPEPKKAAATETGPSRWLKDRTRLIPIVLIFAAFLLATGAVLYFSGPEPATVTSLVKYSTVLSNSSNESYLGLDIQNPDGMQNEMEMMLPQNVDRSISARGGVVTISHTANTLVRLNSSGDASVKIYLSGNWTSLPVTMSLGVPEGYDSGLVVHGEDYFVTRKDDTILLRFNLTHEGVDFEQSYSSKR
ncbi:MAG TPA: hypothetical protein VLB04_09515 [Methanotrichaceae archaeon]|nr:hypothetical protein [Methanotrichaceae archaeon]